MNLDSLDSLLGENAGSANGRDDGVNTHFQQTYVYMS